MAPEQAKGRAGGQAERHLGVRRRAVRDADGTAAVRRRDVSDTLAAVLKSEPDWNALPADVPPHIRMLIQRCLAKDRRQRVADISVALFVMTEAAVAARRCAPADRASHAAQPPLWRRLVMPTAAAIVVGAAVGTAVWLATRPTAARVTRFALSPTGAAALSVDQSTSTSRSRRTARTSSTRGRNQRQRSSSCAHSISSSRRRSLDSATPRAPFFSPDGQWIGFVDRCPRRAQESGDHRRTGPPSLPPRQCKPRRQRGATTTASSLRQPLPVNRPPARVVGRRRADGPDETRPRAWRSDHLWPQFLPGSQAVLFTITATTGGIDASQVAVLDLRTGTQKILVRGGSQAQYRAERPSGVRRGWHAARRRV